jgi:hypothetical protein
VIATIVDVENLLEVVWISLGAGVGVSALFALGIYGATRSTDMRRNQRGGVASAYAVVGAVSFLGCLAAIGYGLALMLS